MFFYLFVHMSGSFLAAPYFSQSSWSLWLSPNKLLSGNVSISVHVKAPSFLAGVLWGLGLGEFLLGETMRWRREGMRKGENEKRGKVSLSLINEIVWMGNFSLLVYYNLCGTIGSRKLAQLWVSSANHNCCKFFKLLDVLCAVILATLYGAGYFFIIDTICS